MTNHDLIWDIKTSMGTVTARFATNSPNALNNTTRGETARFTFELINNDVNSLTVESGETHTVESGKTEFYNQVSVADSGTLTVDGTLVVTGASDMILRFDEHAGSFSTTQTLNNTIKYRPQIPSDANIDSPLVGIEPAMSLKERNLRGVWGLVTNVVDERPQALSTSRYTIEVTVVSEFDDYSSHADAQSALQV